ncbi:Heme/copper-type cytochrome/quinol oxidase, subunit 4 [Marininema mesophilum]|uniref:Heme/copper-type cytochrome/quinol oxidase, subunit 4 n=1 Tax=Marininema mesophilum TaxID=1048340 RepID=A0A1H3BCV1_9BACL|nr:cytochrome C oxidase subunit IV family protein [Marininema mesophilum]SDX39635.1 Heme/copper-type cytochrome/quinol oxidase, subunit 4 [Marininema mesophilum]
MTQSNQHKQHRPRETAGRHLISFGWMLLFTAVSFALVSLERFSPRVTFALILVLAFIQFLIQLVSFMHLDRRQQLTILFLTSGIGFSIIIAVGMWWLKG